MAISSKTIGRGLAPLALLITLGASAGGCAAEMDDGEDEDVDTTEAELAKGEIRVTQWNLPATGRYNPFPNCRSGRGAVTWATARNAANLVRSNGILRTTAIFGFQDLGEPHAGQPPTKYLASLLNGGGTDPGTLNANGDFGELYFPSPRGIDTGFVWRKDLVRLVRAFPMGDVGGVNNSSFGANGFRITWGGALFETVAAPTKKIAVFTGKLVWNGEVTAAGRRRPATEADRVAEVRRLDAWIDKNLAGVGNVTRVITVDLNSRARNEPSMATAWEELHRLGYETGYASADVSTSPASKYRQFDQVFWDRATTGGRPTLVPFRVRGGCTASNPGPGGDHDIMSAAVRPR